MTKIILVVVWLSLQCFVYGKAANNNIACKDPDGNDVDWFYAYKLPVHFPVQHDDPRRRGLEFVYLTPQHLDKWRLSPHTIDDPLSAIGRTMSQSYGADIDRLVVAYNDEPPGDVPADGTCGHTKGVLVADMQTAIWVIHSVPRYPDISENASAYSYPSTGHTYAQSFLCMSTDATQLDTIAQQLLFNEPHFYQLRIPPLLVRHHPQLERLLHSNTSVITRPPFSRRATVAGRNGSTTFTSFAKSRHFDRELYAEWLAPTLDTDLLVESWRHGADLLPSNCSLRRRVWNVNGIRMAAVGFEFHTSGDHAKWTVAQQADRANEIDDGRPAEGRPDDWICVGDINRGERQTHRGGGTVCQQHPVLAQRYRELVAGYEPCPQR